MATAVSRNSARAAPVNFAVQSLQGPDRDSRRYRSGVAGVSLLTPRERRERQEW
jgi:hypothetical protein